MPASLGPDIRNITAPDLVRPPDIELPIQTIRNVRSLNRRLLVLVRTRLFANQPRFTHQSANLESTNVRTTIPQHRHNTTTSGSATAVVEQLVDLAAQPQSINIYDLLSLLVVVVAGRRNLEGTANKIDRFMLS